MDQWPGLGVPYGAECRRTSSVWRILETTAARFWQRLRLVVKQAKSKMISREKEKKAHNTKERSQTLVIFGWKVSPRWRGFDLSSRIHTLREMLHGTLSKKPCCERKKERIVPSIVLVVLRRCVLSRPLRVGASLGCLPRSLWLRVSSSYSLRSGVSSLRSLIGGIGQEGATCDSGLPCGTLCGFAPSCFLPSSISANQICYSCDFTQSKKYRLSFSNADPSCKHLYGTILVLKLVSMVPPPLWWACGQACERRGDHRWLGVKG